MFVFLSVLGGIKKFKIMVEDLLNVVYWLDNRKVGIFFFFMYVLLIIVLVINYVSYKDFNFYF